MSGGFSEVQSVVLADYLLPSTWYLLHQYCVAETSSLLQYMIPPRPHRKEMRHLCAFYTPESHN